jgi:hypothetical protein
MLLSKVVELMFWKISGVGSMARAGRGGVRQFETLYRQRSEESRSQRNVIAQVGCARVEALIARRAYRQTILKPRAQ